MNFTITTLPLSIAGTLAPYFPENFVFLDDPAQQSADDMPCAFLQTRYAYIKRLVQAEGGYWERRIGLDLTYLDDYNLPDLAQRYTAAAELLDEHLDRIAYTDTEPTEENPTPDTIPILTHDRSYTVDQDALHYQFEIRVRVSKPEDGSPMQTLTQNIHVKEALQNG